MFTTVLTVDDIRTIVQKVGLDRLMDEMIERLEQAFREYDPERIQIPARSGFSYNLPASGLMEWMPVMETGRQVTVKMVGYHPNNPDRYGLPTILSTVSSYDTATGHLLGLADGVFLTALRTGAASAVASKYMAHEDSRIVGLIGCGAQAVTQLHALSRLFDIQSVLAYDLHPERAASFVERAAITGLDIRPVRREDLGTMLAQVDILSTCTSVDVKRGPVFEDTGLKAHLHINAVGSDFPGKCEVPLSVLKRAFVVPDFHEQAINEGESQQLSAVEIGPSIAEVVQSWQEFGQLRYRMTVFDSTGWALEDEAAMKMLLGYASELGVGTQLRLEAVPRDPHHPYDFVLEQQGAVPGD